MRIFIMSSCLAVLSCCAANKTPNTQTKDNADTNSANQRPIDSALPACVKKMIVQYQQEEKQNPPRRIYQYRYNNKIVYFVPAICCDFFSDLYDDQCNLIGHPDGGYTGKGDGKTGDFLTAKTNEKLIWKDSRE